MPHRTLEVYACLAGCIWKELLRSCGIELEARVFGSVLARFPTLILLFWGGEECLVLVDQKRFKRDRDERM